MLRRLLLARPASAIPSGSIRVPVGGDLLAEGATSLHGVCSPAGVSRMLQGRAPSLASAVRAAYLMNARRSPTELIAYPTPRSRAPLSAFQLARRENLRVQLFRSGTCCSLTTAASSHVHRATALRRPGSRERGQQLTTHLGPLTPHDGEGDEAAEPKITEHIATQSRRDRELRLYFNLFERRLKNAEYRARSPQRLPLVPAPSTVHYATHPNRRAAICEPAGP